MEPKLRVEGATKVYASKTGPVHALEDFSLDVHEGELVCILGPSGCGKTTLLWALSGLHALTSGRILLDGTAVAGPRPHEIGMIFQEANLLPWRNLRQNIEFPFEIKKRPVDAARDRTGRVRRFDATRAVRRDAAARLDRPRARPEPGRAPNGRAVRRSRRVHPR